MVQCPKKGHGTCPIVSGDNTLIIDGKPVARHGDKTSCGAMLIASQQNSTADQLTSAATAAVTSGKQELSFEDFFSPYDEEYEQDSFNDSFQLIDQIKNEPLVHCEYVIKRQDGSMEKGVTDEHGCTHLLAAEIEAEEVSVYIAG